MSEKNELQDIMISGDQRIKLTRIMDECMQSLFDIDTLKAGMKDSIKAICEEIGIKPKNLSKAIAAAHKAKIAELKHDASQVESILHATGKDTL